MSTAPDPRITIHSGDERDLAEMMETMETAFDPLFGEAWTRAQALGVLSVTGVWLLIARRGGVSAGFALARIVLDEAELLLIAVRPEQRRAGVGAMLLDGMIAGARARGAVRLHLEVRDGNGALALYRAAGFLAAGRRRAYYRGRDSQVFDAITLSLPLPAA